MKISAGENFRIENLRSPHFPPNLHIIVCGSLYRAAVLMPQSITPPLQSVTVFAAMERKGKTIAQILAATTKRPTLGDDFQYVVHKPKKTRLCFGSIQERNQTPVLSRLGVAETSEVNENLYPGKYASVSEKKVVSLKGTVLGGRTAARKFSLVETDGPSPATYRVKTKPAGSFSFGNLDRFPRFTKFSVVGPGNYNVSAKKRTIAYCYTFGGRRAIIPPIKMKCGPNNADLCEKCKSKPVGDYWLLANDSGNLYLCRPCYEEERKSPKTFSKMQMKYFKKIRDCSQIHFHGGCEARILLTSPRMIEDITKKEAYLSLYFR